MSEVVIVASRDELEAAVEKALRSVMPKIFIETQHKKDAHETDRLSISGAVDFLEREGAPTTRSTLYNLIYNRRIPFSKLGNRVVFSKKELLAWIEARTTRPADARAEAASRIARSAANRQ